MHEEDMHRDKTQPGFEPPCSPPVLLWGIIFNGALVLMKKTFLLLSPQPMIQLEKPVLPGTMPVVWPTILDLGRDECKRILRKLGKKNVFTSVLKVKFSPLRNHLCSWFFILSLKLLHVWSVSLTELEAYAGVISALRAQGDLTKDKKDLLAELTKILG